MSEYKLPAIYNHLLSAHMIYYPELRVCQFIDNFFYWIRKTKKTDPFYLSDDEVVKYVNEFVGRGDK